MSPLTGGESEDTQACGRPGTAPPTLCRPWVPPGVPYSLQAGDETQTGVPAASVSGFGVACRVLWLRHKRNNLVPGGEGSRKPPTPALRSLSPAGRLSQPPERGPSCERPQEAGPAHAHPAAPSLRTWQPRAQVARCLPGEPPAGPGAVRGWGLGWRNSPGAQASRPYLPRPPLRWDGGACSPPTPALLWCHHPASAATGAQSPEVGGLFLALEHP